MSQHILLENGKVIPIQTLRSLTQAELDSPLEKSKRDAFDRPIKKSHGDDKSPPADWVKRRRKPDDGVQYINEDDEISPSFGDEDKLDQTTHRIPDSDQYDDFDVYVHAEVLMPHIGDMMQAARVIGCLTDGEGNPVGQYDPNPMMNTRVYDVMFPDGAIQQYSANIIAESLYENSDEDGFRYQLMDEILDHQKTKDAVEKSGGFVTSKNGQKKYKITTKGWEFLIRWKDGLQLWVPLVDLKESYPVQLAEYAKLYEIDSEPAFTWWVPFASKKRDHIVSGVKARVKKKTRKYGILVATNVEEAYLLDEQNNTTHWRDAIAKEMKNVMVAFKIMDSDDRLRVSFSRLRVNLVFDIKLDLTRKARLVADGHLTPDPIDSTYAGVVSRESVRIALTYAALLGLYLWAADIMNAFV